MTAAAAWDGDKATLMVGEAHHRFANGLQLIVSATNGILRGVHDPDLRERLAALQARVAQLADINRHLAGPFGPDSVSGFALARLCASLAASFDRPETFVAITINGEAPPPARCRTLLLLIGELMTNALKHGLVNEQLCVRIHLIADADRCCLDVCSNTSGRLGSDRPRMAAELAEAAGGTLEVTMDQAEFHVIVVLPSMAASRKLRIGEALMLEL